MKYQTDMIWGGGLLGAVTNTNLFRSILNAQKLGLPLNNETKPPYYSDALNIRHAFFMYDIHISIHKYVVYLSDLVFDTREQY